MKKAYAKKKMPYATLMCIPDDEATIKSLRIPLWVPAFLVLAVISVIVFTFVSVSSLSSLKVEYNESSKKIQELNNINNSQNQQILELEESTAKVQSQLEENTKLLDEVKKAVGIKDKK